MCFMESEKKKKSNWSGGCFDRLCEGWQSCVRSAALSECVMMFDCVFKLEAAQEKYNHM